METIINQEDSFENKSQKVREHIRTYGWIDTYTAIKKYFATRLSAIIFNAKTENGGYMNIGSFIVWEKKMNPKTGKIKASHYAIYYDADQFTEEKIKAKLNLI